MDAADGAVSTSVMLALLPATSEWCQIDLPHMTLVYAGDKSKLSASDFSSLTKDAAALAQLSNGLTMKVQRISVFGDTEKVNVLDFLPSPEILAMRRYVERWNASEFPFNPHATIGPASDFLPPTPAYVRFNRMLLAWGDEQLVFNLNNAY